MKYSHHDRTRCLAAFLVLASMLFLLGSCAFGQTSVLTQHNDNARDGANIDETILTPANVNVSSFGKLFTCNLDDGVNGQVLYVPSLTVNGATHNVMYAYTTGNSNGSASSLWAFDADNGAQLWHDAFPSASEWTTCAPTIDPTTNTIYVLTKYTSDSGPTELHAFDITTGVEKPGSPVEVAASVPGTGDASVDGVVSFNTAQQNDRPALLLLNGIVYITFSHNSDSPPYHGWVIGYSYNGAAFTQTGVFCTTPNGSDGGIWMAGDGPVADANGYIYVAVGNGTFDAASGGLDYGMCYLKLNTPSLTVADYFAPHDEQGWSNGDADTGGAGDALIPNTTAMFGGQTKFGSVFLMNTGNMGKFNATTDNVLNRIDNLCGAGTSTQNPVAWDSGNYKYVYDWAPGSVLMQFRYDPSVGMLNPSGVYLSNPNTAGGGLCVTSNGTADGILWATGQDNALHAYDATNVATELWNSQQDASRDGVGGFPHWTFPTVVNGKLYAPVGNHIVVFGLLGAPVPPPAPTDLGSVAGNGVISLSWSGSVGSTSYNVYRGIASGKESPTPIATGVDGTGYTDTNATNGITYFYTVAAVNGEGTSGMSNETSNTASAGGSGGTPIVQIDCGGSATGTWVADEDFLGGGTQVINNTINTSSVTSPAPQAVYQSNRFGTMSYTIPGLAPGATYTIRLHFSEDYWQAAGKRIFNVVINGTQVLSNFDIFAAAGGEYIANVQQFTTAANSTGQIVLAFNTVTDNAQINGIEVLTPSTGTVPPVPTGLNAKAGDTLVSLTWNASAGATSYAIYRGNSSNGEGATPYATSTTASYNDTGVTDGNTYYYEVAAVNSAGTSAASSQVTATPLQAAPTTPTDLTATPANGSVSLAYSGSPTATSFNLYRSTVSGGEGAVPFATGVVDNPFIDTNVTNGVTYYYTIAGVNSGGVSGQSNEAHATPTVAIPAAPANLTATPGSGQVALIWNASAGAASYSVYRGVTSGGESATPIVSGLTTTSYTDTNVVSGTLYYYEVTANSSAGISSFSNEAYATPTAATGSGVISINAGGPATGSWLADEDFSGGGPNTWTNAVNTTQLTGTVPPQTVLQSDREGGTFTYTVPSLTAGSTYPVTLYFVEQYWTSAGHRIFNVTANGTPVVSNLDVYATAGGKYIAIQKSFNAVANASGQIVLAFSATVDQAKCSGILIGSGATLPTAAAPTFSLAAGTYATAQSVALADTTPGATIYYTTDGTAPGITSSVYAAPISVAYTQTINAISAAASYNTSAPASAAYTITSGTGGASVSINCGGASTGGWLTDTYFSGGGSNTWTNAVSTTLLTGTVPPQAVLQTDREGGTVTYTLPSFAPGSTHSVTLYFVEQYWSAAGKRVFSVTANGTTVITNLDVYATAGGKYIAIQKTFNATANASGQIVLKFQASVDQAKCSGIVVD